jgi:hypothetical protein
MKVDPPLNQYEIDAMEQGCGILMKRIEVIDEYHHWALAKFETLKMGHAFM